MRPVSDDFLLNIAQVSAALVGLFFVGVFFFVETGFRRSTARETIEPYFRAATAIVLVCYAIPIGLSLSLVALEIIWSRVLFALMSLALVAISVQTATRVRRVTTSPIVVANEVFATLATVPLVITPWALGGLEPTREDLTWSILLAFALGFFSISTLVLSAFDISSDQVGKEES